MGSALNVSLIVAADDRHGIAKQGQIPWHLPSDLARFKRLTVGQGRNAVLMGRTTWESLPQRFRPLPTRLNLVLSNTRQDFAGATCVTSWDEALAEARACDHLWVIGGAAVYALALAKPDTQAIELTRVSGDFGCDLRWGGVPAGYGLASIQPGDGYSFERWVPL